MHALFLLLVAQVTPTINNIGDALGVVQTLIGLARSGMWAPAVGLFLMVLVWVLRTYVAPNLPSKYLPWAAAISGGLCGIGVGFAGLPVGASWLSWVQVGVFGAFTGLGGAGFWSLLGRHILPEGKTDAGQPK